MVKKTAFKKAFGPAQREAFDRATRALTSAPVPKFPDFKQCQFASAYDNRASLRC